MSPTCPCCGRQGFSSLLRFDAVPVSGHFLASPTDPVNVVDIALEVCTDCGLVRQNPFACKPDYSGVNRPTARQVPRYVQRLLEKLAALGVGPRDLILEIGCNDGSFLECLRGAGFTNVLGVEPSTTL